MTDTRKEAEETVSDITNNVLSSFYKKEVNPISVMKTAYGYILKALQDRDKVIEELEKQATKDSEIIAWHQSCENKEIKDLEAKLKEAEDKYKPHESFEEYQVAWEELHDETKAKLKIAVEALKQLNAYEVAEQALKEIEEK